jgi:hypothetical protein
MVRSIPEYGGTIFNANDLNQFPAVAPSNSGRDLLRRHTPFDYTHSTFDQFAYSAVNKVAASSIT